MPEPTAVPEHVTSGPRMTLRTYRVCPDGRIVDDSGVRLVPPVEALPLSDGYPPCRCPRHRALLAAVRAAW
jgi:hypothetical protein